MIYFDCKLAGIVVYDIILFIPAAISLNSVSCYTLCLEGQFMIHSIFINKTTNQLRNIFGIYDL